MKKKLTWKQKNRLLLTGSIIMLWAVYAFAISNTLDARSECRNLEQQLDSAADAPARLAQLHEELLELETITGKDTANAFHEHLLGIVTQYCRENDLMLRGFAQPVRYRQQEWTIETHPVLVEGPYIALLQLVHRLEQEKTGKVVSVDFHSKRDNKTKALSLLVTIYVQNIIREAS